MDQFPHDGARADDGHLHRDIIEVVRFEAWQGRHLGPALNLKNAHRVGAAHCLEGGPVILRDLVQGGGPSSGAAELKGVLESGHHAQPKKIHFHDTKIFAIVLVPLHNDASRHGGRLERHDAIEITGANDHAARVLSEVTRQPLHPVVDAGQGGQTRVGPGQSRHGNLILHRDRLRKVAVGEETGEPVEHIIGQSEDLAQFASCAAPAVGDDIRRHGGTARSVATIDFLNDGFAQFTAGQIKIDVRPRGMSIDPDATLTQESFEQELLPDGVDRGDS